MDAVQVKEDIVEIALELLGKLMLAKGIKVDGIKEEFKKEFKSLWKS